MNEIDANTQLDSQESSDWGEPADYTYLLKKRKDALTKEIDELNNSQVKEEKDKIPNLKRHLFLEKQKSLNQFAWEFLRRNKEYQEDYYNYADYPRLDDLANHADDTRFFYTYYESDPPAQEGESYTAWSERKVDEKLVKGYSAKRDNFIAKYDLQPHADMQAYNPRNRRSPGFYSLDSEYPVMRNPKIAAVKFYSLSHDYADEMVVKINVLMPLDEQFNKIRIAADKRISRFESLNQPKDNDELYILYLRLLDAIDQGAKRSEIYFYLYNKDFFEKKENKSNRRVTASGGKDYSPSLVNNRAYTVTVIAFGGPGRPRHLGFDPARGSKPWLSHDSTPFRDALQFF